MTSPHKTTMLTPIASHAPQPQPAPYPHITAITASHCLLLHPRHHRAPGSSGVAGDYDPPPSAIGLRELPSMLQ